MATAHTNFNNALASGTYLIERTKLVNARESINVQVNLENSNLSRIRTYVQGITDYQSYVALAEDPDLRTLMTRISQTPEWIAYFTNYVENFNALNPAYNITSDSDKSSVIDQILATSGLPDVVDFLDIDGVASKSRRDNRIDTKGYDALTVEQQITKSCEQLGLVTANRTIFSQSESLLSNMNQHDRDEVARALDLNESSTTLS